MRFEKESERKETLLKQFDVAQAERDSAAHKRDLAKTENENHKRRYRENLLRTQVIRFVEVGNLEIHQPFFASFVCISAFFFAFLPFLYEL